ncbi:MAG: tRNA uridine-5-carboxymethylaminomethyl(34) synthesis GTPase MnmE [Muribaculaceae bacterium]|nr:tRNA uridine-5-carboxymethylaminomethyl(34) synthesis GTPase MnmE [Muribaculaceae bacterium]
MALNQETICAISTPAGTGGIAVARISGPEKEIHAILNKCWTGVPAEKMTSHSAHLGTVTDPQGQPLDQAVLTLFREPRSFTGQTVAEISVHGSLYIQRMLLQTLMNAGARMARPGEFTERAFLNGRMDLAQAEGVADMIAANSAAAHKLAMAQLRGTYSQHLKEVRDQLLELAALLELELDFSEEDVEFADRTKLIELAQGLLETLNRLTASFKAGNAIKNGIPVAIVGPTNAGKSSLLNALLGEQRAIVSNIHGTTRDTVEDHLEIGPYMYRFIDTAGIRETTDPIEKLGIERSEKAMSNAAIRLYMVDALDPVIPVQLPSDTILVINKTDAAAAPRELPREAPVVTISALHGSGLDTLRTALTAMTEKMQNSTGMNYSEAILVTNARHAQELEEAATAASRALDGLQNQLPADLVAQDLRQTIHHLGAITGTITTPQILSHIFQNFCIGK